MGSPHYRDIIIGSTMNPSPDNGFPILGAPNVSKTRIGAD